MHSLNPAGLPPDKRRISPMNFIISIGVAKAEWLAGEMQSTPIGMPRVIEISSLTFAAGNTPWPGLAPWLIFSSTILICGCFAVSANFSGENRRRRCARRNSPIPVPR